MKFRLYDKTRLEYLNFELTVSNETCAKLECIRENGSREVVLEFISDIMWLKEGMRTVGIREVSNLTGRELEFNFPEGKLTRKSLNSGKVSK